MPDMFCTSLLVLLLFSLQNQFLSCHSYLVSQSVKMREFNLQCSDSSDFMGDIARDRVTIKSLAKLAATSSVEKGLLDQFKAPTNFEVMKI